MVIPGCGRPEERYTRATCVNEISGTLEDFGLARNSPAIDISVTRFADKSIRWIRTGRSIVPSLHEGDLTAVCSFEMRDARLSRARRRISDDLQGDDT